MHSDCDYFSSMWEHQKWQLCFSAGHKRVDNGGKMHLFSQYATEQKTGKVFIHRIDIYWFQPTLHAQHGKQTHTLQRLTIRRRRSVRHIFLWWRNRFVCLLLTKIKVFHPSHKRWFRNNRPSFRGLKLGIFKESGELAKKTQHQTWQI